MANQIIIAKGTQSVTMPLVRSITYSGTSEEVQATMASQQIVTDVVGFRPSVTAEWDWVPADTITALNALLQLGGFFTVTHPTPSGEVTESMIVSFPEFKIFAFRNGVPIWHDVRLTMQAQEVIPSAANQSQL